MQMDNTITHQLEEPQVETKAEPQVEETKVTETKVETKIEEPNEEAQSTKPKVKNKVTCALSQFYTKNKTTIILAAVFLVSLFMYLLVHSFAHTEESTDNEQYVGLTVNKSGQAYLNLLSAKFSKFQVAVLHWNDVSGDTWRWDSWDRSRQAEALIEYLRAYDDLYIKHTELDAGSEARVLWVYALTMERISIAKKCSYADALDIIATKPVTEVVSILHTKSLNSVYVAELKKL